MDVQLRWTSIVYYRVFGKAVVVSFMTGDTVTAEDNGLTVYRVFHQILRMPNILWKYAFLQYTIHKIVCANRMNIEQSSFSRRLKIKKKFTNLIRCCTFGIHAYYYGVPQKDPN